MGDVSSVIRWNPTGGNNIDFDVLAATGYTFDDGRRVHIVIVSEGTSAKLYVDGLFIEEKFGVVKLIRDTTAFLMTQGGNFFKGTFFNCAVVVGLFDDADVLEAYEKRDAPLTHSRIADYEGLWENRGNLAQGWDDQVGINHGTVNGTPALVHDSRGSSVVKDVSGLPLTRPRDIELANFAFNGVIDIAADASIENLFAGGGGWHGWIRADNPITNQRIFETNGGGFDIRTQDATARIKFVHDFSTTNGDFRTPSAAILPGIWSCLSIGYDSDNVANLPVFFIDGVSIGVTVQAAPVGVATTDVGAVKSIGNTSGGSLAADGGLDEIIMQTSIPTLQNHIDFYDATKDAHPNP